MYMSLGLDLYCKGPSISISSWMVGLVHSLHPNHGRSPSIETSQENVGQAPSIGNGQSVMVSGKMKGPLKQILFGTRERDILNIHYRPVNWFSIWLSLFVMFLSTAALFDATFVHAKMFDFFTFLFSYFLVLLLSCSHTSILHRRASILYKLAMPCNNIVC